MNLVHYGSAKYRPESFREISDVPFSKKPSGGLWCSPVESEWGWKDWCESESYGDLDESFCVEFSGDLLVIDCVLDMNKLPWIENSGIHFIAFQPLCVGGFAFDAIHLTVCGERETRFSRPRSLYGWACECVLILNPDSIKDAT